MGDRWSASEDAILRLSNEGEESFAECAVRLPGRSRCSCIQRAHKIGEVFVMTPRKRAKQIAARERGIVTALRRGAAICAARNDPMNPLSRTAWQPFWSERRQTQLRFAASWGMTLAQTASQFTAMTGRQMSVTAIRHAARRSGGITFVRAKCGKGGVL